MTKNIRNEEIEKHLAELRAEVLRRIPKGDASRIVKAAGIDSSAITNLRNEKKSLDWKTFYRLLFVLVGSPPQIFPQHINESKPLKTLRMIKNLLKDLEDFPS